MAMKKTTSGVALLSGPLASCLFYVCLIGFAAVRPEYSHATKAISELGAVGAPNALAFNILGFIAPGLLLVVFASALKFHLGAKWGSALLALSGLAFVAAGVFAVDMDARSSPQSTAHLAGAMLTGLFFAFALFPLGRSLSKFGLAAWGRITPWFLSFMFLNVGWQAVYQATGSVNPGWGQRIAFAGFFTWILITGLLLWKKTRSVSGNQPLIQSSDAR